MEKEIEKLTKEVTGDDGLLMIGKYDHELLAKLLEASYISGYTDALKEQLK